MSWKTLVAFVGFSVLTLSMMMDESTQTYTRAAQPSSAEVVNFDFALTSQELVFSESMKPVESGQYLIPSHQYDELNSHSAEIILQSLSALPKSEDSQVVLTRKEFAGSSSTEL
jgi:hypothetical protein